MEGKKNIYLKRITIFQFIRKFVYFFFFEPILFRSSLKNIKSINYPSIMCTMYTYIRKIQLERAKKKKKINFDNK